MPNQQQIKHNNFHPALRILFVFLLSFYLISLTQMDLAGITDEQIVEAVLQTLEGIRGKAELFDIPTNNLQAVPTGGSELTSGRSLRTVQDQSTATSDEPGWFYNFITLNSQTCSPTPTAVSGVTTNQCVRNQDDTSRSVYVTCNSDSSVTVDRFQNGNCDKSQGNYISNTTQLTCASQLINTDQYQGYIGVDSFCTNSTNLQFPKTNAYATYRYYNDKTCQFPLSYSGLVNNQCIPVTVIQNGQSVKLSVKVQYPNILVYGYATCQFMVIHTISNAFVSACMLNTNDDLPIADDIIGNDMIGGFGYRSAGLFENGGTDITPTAQPAFQPTPAPATGWVYSFINYGSQCDTESSPVARGYSVDACLTSIDQSWRYSCDSQYLYRDYYSSGNCDPDSLVTRKKQLLGCKVNKDERGNNVATYFGCSNEAMEPILPSSQTLYYGTYEYFDDSSCDSLLHYQSVVNKKCVTIGGPTSIFVDYPTQYIYNTPNCTGKPTTYTAFNQECTNYLHSSFVQRVMTEEQVELEDASYYFDTRPQFTYQSSSLLQGTPVQSNSNDGLSTGAIAGIAIGCVAAVTIVGFAIYYLVAFKFVSASAAQASSAAGVNGSVETSTIHNPVHAEEK